MAFTSRLCFQLLKTEMTTTDTKTLSMSDAAVLLRAQLGDLRTWYPFLADNIRGRQDIYGSRLMPCGRQLVDRSWRPIYAVADIQEFVAKVLAAVPSAGKMPIRVSVLPIDHSRHWRENRFDDYGAPARSSRHVPTHHARA